MFVLPPVLAAGSPSGWPKLGPEGLKYWPALRFDRASCQIKLVLKNSNGPVDVPDG